MNVSVSFVLFRHIWKAELNLYRYKASEILRKDLISSICIALFLGVDIELVVFGAIACLSLSVVQVLFSFLYNLCATSDWIAVSLHVGTALSELFAILTVMWLVTH